MKVRVTVTDAEVREAIREWLEAHGVPNVILDKLKIEAKPTTGSQANFHVEVRDLQVTGEYEADSLTPHEGRPIEEPAPASPRKLKAGPTSPAF